MIPPAQVCDERKAFFYLTFDVLSKTFILNLSLLIFIGFTFCCKSEQKQEPYPITKNKTDTSTSKRPIYHPTYTESLDSTIQTIIVDKIMFACQCADWRIKKVNEVSSKYLLSKDIFIEPLDSSLNLPDTIGYGGDRIKLWGQFYRRKGFPKNYPVTEMNPDTAKVFRYIKYKIIRSYYKNYKED